MVESWVNIARNAEYAEAGYNELGHLVRQLHGTLHELGCDEAMQSMVGELPDAQDRLNYIAQLTEQAAQRVLGAVEKAMPLQEKMETDALPWPRNGGTQRGMANSSRSARKCWPFSRASPAHTRETSSQLTDIMMAQDFRISPGR